MDDCDLIIMSGETHTTDRWKDLAVVMGLLLAVFGFMTMGRNPIILHWVFYAVPGTLMILGILIRMFLKDQYVIDVSKWEIYSDMEFLGFPYKRHIASFQDILGITTTGHKVGRVDNVVEWHYQTIMVLQNGRFLPITKPLRDGLQEANEKAFEFAGYLRVPYVVGRIDCFAELMTAEDGRLIITQRSYHY